MSALRGHMHEGIRYFAASAIALAVDVGLLSGLVFLAGVNYLIATPIGFSCGLVVIYVLSIRWVFQQRRVKDSRAEFTLFAALGLTGLGLNQLVVYTAVDGLGLPVIAGKLISAGLVFCFNFASRKFLLFTRYR